MGKVLRLLIWQVHIPTNLVYKVQIKWSEEGQLSKLLGTPFGLNLNTPDVDQFLYTKITKKLDY